MNASQDIILKLRYELQKLVSLYESEKKKVIELENDMATMKKVLAGKDIAIKNLENNNNKLMLASAFKHGSSDAQEAKKKIAKLVREIDKCVALLNQ